VAIVKRKTKTGAVRARAVVQVDGRQVVGKWADLATAKRDERELLARRDTGQLQPAAGLTVAAYLDRYLAELLEVSATGQPIRPTTAAKYRDQLRRITAQLGEVQLTALRPEHVTAYRQQLTSDGLHASTVRGDLALLGRALRDAVNAGLIARNPAAADVVRRPRGKAEPAPHIDVVQARAILEAVSADEVLDPIVHLALGAGLRREEILGLKWSRVDLEAGTLEVVEVYTSAGWAAPKTDAGARSIVLPPYVLEALRRHRTAQLERQLASSRSWAEPELVVSNAGRPYAPTSVSRAWRLFAADHGWAGITLHDLRHGGAQMLVDAGVPLEQALRFGGWSNGEMLRYYAPNLSPAQAQQVAATLGEHYTGGA